MNFDCFIFDFDGTLAHSEPAYREAFRHTIKVHTGCELDESEAQSFWMMTPQEVFGRYNQATPDQMLVTFEQHYYSNHHNHLIAYNGINELLEVLKKRGVRIAVVSSKPRRAGERELDITGLRNLVQFAVWGDDIAMPKPDPGGVFSAMRRLEAVPDSTVVVGDSPADIMMGRKAGVKTAAALWGGTNRQSLMAAQPDMIFNTPFELLNAIGEHLNVDVPPAPVPDQEGEL